jgi:hypothetical protein
VDGPVRRVTSLPYPRACRCVAGARRTRGGQPRRRAVDLAIAATANIHQVPLITHNTADFESLATS